MDKTQGTQGSIETDDTIIKVQAPHNKMIGRISALASSPNQVYVGTVGGEISVLNRVTGERLERQWDSEKRCIEGVMFDYEGKMVYATEYNLVMLDKELTRKVKEYRSVDPLPLSHITGRRMIPTLDHTKVAWWGNRNSLSIIDLEKLTVTDYPMVVGGSKSALITYDIGVIFQQLYYMISENGEYRMLYQYDMRNHSVIGLWMYENPLCKLLLTQSSTTDSPAEAWLSTRSTRFSPSEALAATREKTHSDPSSQSTRSGKGSSPS